MEKRGEEYNSEKAIDKHEAIHLDEANESASNEPRTM
jgi:hypothetical protein